MKRTREKFASRSLLSPPPKNNTPTDDALDILSTMGIGVIENTLKQPNPRSPEQGKSRMQADFSLLKIETDMTRILSAKIFDKKSQDKKLTEPEFVKIIDLYLAPSKVPDGVSNIFKPDDNKTDFEKGREIKTQKASKKNLVKLTEELIRQQKRISTKIMDPQFKIVMNKQGI
jgi:hypothetical protein